MNRSSLRIVLPVVALLLAAGCGDTPHVEPLWTVTSQGDAQVGHVVLAPARDGGIALAARPFGPLQLGTYTVSGDGLLLARYDTSGALEWAKQDAGVGLWRAAPHPDGGFVVAGLYSDRAVFDASGPNECVLPLEGDFVPESERTGTSPEGQSYVRSEIAGVDIYLAHYLADGALAWATREGGKQREEIAGLSVSDDGRSFIAGTLSQAAVFGAGEVHETTLECPRRSYYVAKLDGDGTLEWAACNSDDAGTAASAVLASPDGGALVAGRIHAYPSARATIRFASGEPGQTDVPLKRRRSVFLARYDTNGRLTWVRWIASPGDDDCRALAWTASGDIVASGVSSDAAEFDDGAGGTVATPPGEQELYLACYTAAGKLRWVARAGGRGIEAPQAVAGLPDGDILLSGFHGVNDYSPGSEMSRKERAAVFGEGEPDETRLVPDQEDGGIFVARYRFDGTLRWAESLPAAEGERITDMVLDGGTLWTAGIQYPTPSFSQRASGWLSEISSDLGSEFDYERYPWPLFLKKYRLREDAP